MGSAAKIMLIFGFILSALSCSDRPRRERFPGTEGSTVGGAPGASKAVLGGFDPNAATVQVDRDTSRGIGQYTISGTIQVDPAVKYKNTALVFIAARPLNGGRPLAVKRYLARELPIQFLISEADAMTPDTVFAGEVELNIRLDNDGDAWSRQPEDLEVVLPAKVGDSGLTVTLK